MKAQLGLSEASIKQVQAAMGVKLTAVMRALARGTTKAAFRIQKRAIERIMNGPKSGIVYGTESDKAKVKAGGKGSRAAAKRVHQASAPGESPANDLGHLQRSINVVAASPAIRCEARVVVKEDYGEWLEFGTKDGRIAARPFLQPAADESVKAATDDIRAELEAVLK